MNYKKINFKSPVHKLQKSVTNELLTNALQECFDLCSFSTLPYKMYGFNSKESIFKTGTGNCIAMTYFMKNWLMKNHHIDSYLIPCTIPKKYQKPEYLALSHVALAIPKSKDQVFIVDMAFYFSSPICVLLNDDQNISRIQASNIYLNKIDTIVATTKKTTETIVFNEFQKLPSNVFYSECYSNDHVDDKWQYYLMNVVNPDAAISNYYLQISNPFITTTKYSSDRLSCQMNVYIKFTDNNQQVLVKIDGENYYEGDPRLFTNSQFEDLANAMGKFYDPNLPLYFKGKTMFNYFDF